MIKVANIWPQRARARKNASVMAIALAIASMRMLCITSADRNAEQHHVMRACIYHIYEFECGACARMHDIDIRVDDLNAKSDYS